MSTQLIWFWIWSYNNPPFPPPLLFPFGSNQIPTSFAALDFGCTIKMCRNYIVNTISGLIFPTLALAISLWKELPGKWPKQRTIELEPIWWVGAELANLMQIPAGLEKTHGLQPDKLWIQETKPHVESLLILNKVWSDVDISQTIGVSTQGDGGSNPSQKLEMLWLCWSRLCTTWLAKAEWFSKGLKRRGQWEPRVSCLPAAPSSDSNFRPSIPIHRHALHSIEWPCFLLQSLHCMALYCNTYPCMF